MTETNYPEDLRTLKRLAREKFGKKADFMFDKYNTIQGGPFMVVLKGNDPSYCRILGIGGTIAKSFEYAEVKFSKFSQIGEY